MDIIGELYDQKMAKELVGEMEKLGFSVQMQEFENDSGRIIQLQSLSNDTTGQAREYFRVRMGLPGAPVEIDPAWLEIKAKPFGVVTKALILISVCLYLVSFNDEYFSMARELLSINSSYSQGFESIRNFELWRLVTPIFLHFGWMHILFNCMWIKDLGSYWESEVGLKGYTFFVFALGITSNIAQYIASGPNFGGLSGVVYGLFGLSWGRTLLGDKEALQLPKRDIYLMVGWYFLCLSGAIGNIANVAHGVGLGVGLLLCLLVPKFKESGPQVGDLKVLKIISLATFFCLSSFAIEFLKKSYF